MVVEKEKATRVVVIYIVMACFAGRLRNVLVLTDPTLAHLSYLVQHAGSVLEAQGREYSDMQKTEIDLNIFIPSLKSTKLLSSAIGILWARQVALKRGNVLDVSRSFPSLDRLQKRHGSV